MNLFCLFCKDVLYNNFIINKKKCSCLRTEVDQYSITDVKLIPARRSIIGVTISNILISNNKYYVDLNADLLMLDDISCHYFCLNVGYCGNFNLNIKDYHKLIRLLKNELLLK